MSSNDQDTSCGHCSDFLAKMDWLFFEYFVLRWTINNIVWSHNTISYLTFNDFLMKVIKCKYTSIYALDQSLDVTTWNGRVMEKECLQNLKIDDAKGPSQIHFRNRSLQWINRYIKVTKIISPTHLFGLIADPYIHE
jgi:hypothetical protein